MLCVYPQSDMEPIHAVKWHPQDPDLVAVASENNVYLINIVDAHHAYGGEPIAQMDLHRVGQIFSVPSVRTTPCLRMSTLLTNLPAHCRLRLRRPAVGSRDHLRRLHTDDVEHS